MVAVVASVIMLMMLVVHTFQKKPPEERVLTSVLPGVNLPINQLAYYLLTLLLCGVFHELGHAVAATRENVKVQGFGLFVMAVYPGAFVDLYTDHLTAISPLRQLRIYCAGIWHNFILVLVALGVYYCLPFLMLPLFQYGHGVSIRHVAEGSVVYGPRGLFIGDHVTALSQCDISSVDNWISCINRSMKAPNHGYCMDGETIQHLDVATSVTQMPQGNIECCDESMNSHLCFYRLKHQKMMYSCLPARSTIKHPTCLTDNDCLNPVHACVVPSVDNSTKLINVKIKGRDPIIYLGHPIDLHYSGTYVSVAQNYHLCAHFIHGLNI